MTIVNLLWINAVTILIALDWSSYLAGLFLKSIESECYQSHFLSIAIFVLQSFWSKISQNGYSLPKSIRPYVSWILLSKWGHTWITLAIFVIYSTASAIFILHKSIFSRPMVHKRGTRHWDITLDSYKLLSNNNISTYCIKQEMIVGPPSTEDSCEVHLRKPIENNYSNRELRTI